MAITNKRLATPWVTLGFKNGLDEVKLPIIETVELVHVSTITLTKNTSIYLLAEPRSAQDQATIDEINSLKRQAELLGCTKPSNDGMLASGDSENDTGNNPTLPRDKDPNQEGLFSKVKNLFQGEATTEMQKEAVNLGQQALDLQRNIVSNALNAHDALEQAQQLKTLLSKLPVNTPTPGLSTVSNVQGVMVLLDEQVIGPLKEQGFSRIGKL